MGLHTAEPGAPGAPVRCALCRIEPDGTGRCPDCGQDLAPLVHVAALPALHYNRALERAAAGDDDGAVAALQRALEDDPGLVDAWTVLGKVHARNGRTDQARAAWERALEVVPEHRAATEALAALATVTEARTREATAAERARVRAERRERRRAGWWRFAAAALALLAVGLLVALLIPRPDRLVPGPSTPPPAAVTIAARGSDLVLGGTVGDAATRQEYAAAAAAAAGDRRVTETVVVVDGVAPAPGLDAGVVGGVVGVLAGVAPGDRVVALDGARVVLSGAVPEEGARRDLVERLRRAVPGREVDDRLVVDPAAAGAYADRVDEELAAIQAASPILFDPQSGSLMPQGRATVALVAQYLRREPAVRVHVDGHAARNAQTDPALAQQISQARADAVRALLTASGVDPARLDVRGLGDRFPLPDRAASRRVVIGVAR